MPPARGSRPSRSSGTGETRSRRGALVVVSCGAVNSAALLLRSANDRASRRPGELVRARRPALHGAPGDDDAGVSSVPDATTTVFQKTVAINDFYLRGPDTPYPLGQIQSQGRTHGVMAQTVVPWIPLWAYDAWVARGVDWLAMSEDLPRDENRVTRRRRDGRIRLHYRPNNSRRTRSWSSETDAHPAAARLLVVVTHSHGSQNTTHQCGTLVLRHRSAHVGARSVLPRARRRESVRRRRVVLPFVGRRQSGLTIVGAGAARRGSHQELRAQVQAQDS